MPRILPDRGSFFEGLALFALGSIAGSVLITLLYLSHPRAAAPIAEAATRVVVAKVEAAQSAGLGLEVGILLSNLLALGIIVLFPAFAYRVERDRRFAYSTVPRLMMVLIGFESIGITSPPLSDTASYLFFLLYLLPHGVLEFSSLAVAYTIAREGFSAARFGFAFLLLIPAAYIETNISLGFAEAALRVLSG
ncbi:hypothetical protein [Candidatus Pyrohabitans sp.]